jgi:hypothetical protein
VDWYLWLELLGSWWQRLEHLVVAIAIGGSVWWLRQERAKLDISIKTLSQQLSALEDAIEEGSVQPEPAASAEHWEQIRQMWADMRERMEYAIERNIRGGKKLRKYSNLQRYNYAEIITSLRQDLGLSAEVEDALQRMNGAFLSLRRAKAATNEHASWFWAHYQRADKALPKIPGDTD